MMHPFVLLLACCLPILLPAQSPAVPVTDVVSRSTRAEKSPLAYPPLREADLLREKHVWRSIDTRERINHSFRNAAAPLISVLLAGVESGQLQAFSAETDDFSYPLRAEELLGQLRRRDTVTVYDPVSGAATPRGVTDAFDPETVTHYRLKEVWYFDSRESTQRVRILGIAPVVQERTPDGTATYERVLCWFNYPNSRDFLARRPVVLPGNTMPPMSWEDLFEMRFFESHITKEQNVPDERPQDRHSGRDLLQRAERSEQDVFNREHDVWEY